MYAPKKERVNENRNSIICTKNQRTQNCDFVKSDKNSGGGVNFFVHIDKVKSGMIK